MRIFSKDRSISKTDIRRQNIGVITFAGTRVETSPKRAEMLHLMAAFNKSTFIHGAMACISHLQDSTEKYEYFNLAGRNICF